MNAIDRDAIAEAMALVDEYDGCFQRVRDWEALPEWERDAHPDERPDNDYEDREFWRKRADRALALVQPVEGITLTPDETLTTRLRALHRQGGVKAKGYPQGWCLHDHHPWPCPTVRVVGQAAS